MMMNTQQRKSTDSYFLPETAFEPQGILKNSFMQSSVSQIVNPFGITYERKRLTTIDNDFIDVDIATPYGYEHLHDDPKAPIVLMLPNLLGKARWGYIGEYYRQLAARGIRSIGLNYRGCSGELNSKSTLYFMAHNMRDAETALRWIRQKYPEAPIGAVALSYGTCFLLNVLGRASSAEDLGVSAAVAVSPAYDYGKSLPYLSQTKYNPLILYKLKKKLWEKRDDLKDIVDVKRAMSARTVTEYDQFCTALGSGFTNALDYYDYYSAHHQIPKIQTPTLLLRSIDDPLWDATDIPHQQIEDNEYLTSVLTSYGGHIGFYDNRTLPQGGWWGHKTAVDFLEKHLMISG